MQKLIAILLGRTSVASIMGPFEKILTNLHAHAAIKDAEAAAHAVKAAKFASLEAGAVDEIAKAKAAAANIEVLLGLRVAPAIAEATKAAFSAAKVVDAASTLAVKVEVDAGKAIDTLKAVSTAASDAQAGLSAVASAVNVVANVLNPVSAPVVTATVVGDGAAELIAKGGTITLPGATGLVETGTAFIPAVLYTSGLQDATGCCPTGLVDGVCATPGQPCGVTGATGNFGVVGTPAFGVTGATA